MKAMIYAAGYGTRLRPLTEKVPKPLIKVRNKPLLDWIIPRLRQNGIKSVIINTHHLHDRIAEHLNKTDYGVPIEISYEKEILGTGGGLLKTKDFWGTDDFYLCNADILCSASLKNFFEFHKESGNLVSLGTNQRVSDSMLLINESDNLVGIQREGKRVVFTEARGAIRPVGFCGFHMISPKTFSEFSQPICFSIVDEYLKLLGKGITISTWSIGDAYWEDIGTPQSLAEANRNFPGFDYPPSYSTSEKKG